MTRALDDVAFLARSRNRVTVLEALSERHRSRAELEASTGVTKVTAGRVTMRGRMTGPFDGVAPSGRTAATAGFHVLRFEDGRVVEWWRLTGLLGWARQLDVLPFGPRAFLRILGRQLRWRPGGRRTRSA
jgi:hypothetical protein